MGIDTSAGKTPLLEDADQNIGNSATVRPQAPLHAPPASTGTVIPQSLQNRIINLSNGGSARGQTTSVVVTARRIIGGTTDNPHPGVFGPVTGIVEFGNGGRSTRAEFDIPVGPFAGSSGAAASSLEPQDGGVVITVPTGVLRVYARYDNLLVAPVLGTNPPLALAQLIPVLFYGPGGPVGAVPAEPLLVQAMASYFSRPPAKVYKTVYLYVSAGLAIAAPFNTYCLPAFAKSVKVLRQPVSSAVDVFLYDGRSLLESYAIAGGSPSPTIDVVGQETVIGIQSHAPADTLTFLAMACEIGI
jgi:hypothetical protein